MATTLFRHSTIHRPQMLARLGRGDNAVAWCNLLQVTGFDLISAGGAPTLRYGRG